MLDYFEKFSSGPQDLTHPHFSSNVWFPQFGEGVQGIETRKETYYENQDKRRKITISKWVWR